MNLLVQLLCRYQVLDRLECFVGRIFLWFGRKAYLSGAHVD